MFKVISLLTLLLVTPIFTQSQEHPRMAFIDDPKPGTILVLYQYSSRGGCCTIHDILKQLPGPEGIENPKGGGVYYVVEVKQIYQVNEVSTTTYPADLYILLDRHLFLCTNPCTTRSAFQQLQCSVARAPSQVSMAMATAHKPD